MLMNWIENGKTVTAVAGFISVIIARKTGLSIDTADIANAIFGIIGAVGLCHKLYKAISNKPTPPVAKA